LVLTSTILTDKKECPVPAMPLDKLHIPVLVVHHEQDGCKQCSFYNVSNLMNKLVHVPRKQLLSFTGGRSLGDPCKAYAYHGFNGIELDVVKQISAWISAK
jgi:hypothetical protein